MAYGYSRSITVDHTQCGSADSTDFPMLVAGTYSYLKTVANGGKVQHASGFDIAFFSDSGLTTALDFERVNWDASTGECEMWVKVPTLDHSNDTVIYIAYGDSGISSDPQTGAAAWDSNYKAVYHLRESPERGDTALADSTGSRNDLTIETGNPSWGTGSSDVSSASGKVGTGIFFSNPDQYAGLAAKSANDSGMGTGDTTIEGWLNVHSFIETDGGSGAFGCWSNDSYPYTYNGIDVRSDSKIQFIRGNDYNPAFMAGPSGTLSTGTWYHVFGVHDGATALLYINGSLVDTTSVGSGTVDNKIWLGFMDRSGDVSLDEVRFSSGVRSADWITASYNSQNDPASFYTLGSETELGGPSIVFGFFNVPALM